MPSSFKKFRAKALARPAVKKAYDALAEQFAFLDEVLKARAASRGADRSDSRCIRADRRH